MTFPQKKKERFIMITVILIYFQRHWIERKGRGNTLAHIYTLEAIIGSKDKHKCDCEKGVSSVCRSLALNF